MFTARKLRLVRKTDKPAAPYFRAGEPILQSGLYRVFHTEHRISHKAILIAGEVFPRCSECKEDVHFELLESAPTLSDDPGFIRIYELPHPRKAKEDSDAIVA